MKEILLGLPASDTTSPVVRYLIARGDLSGNPSFSDLVERIQEDLAAASRLGPVDPRELAASLGAVADSSFHPVFQVAFARGAEPRPTDPLDLTLCVVEQKGDVELEVTYNRDLFSADTVARLAGCLRILLADACAKPEQSVFNLQMLTDAEWRTVVHEWNSTETDFPQEQCLHELFERQVELNPDAAALVSADTVLSYCDLNRGANQLARHLRALGVVRDQPVGLSVERSPEMIVGLMAIAKAGGAYVPLDPAYPPDRLAWMVEDSGVPVLLTSEGLAPRFEKTDARLVRIDSERDEIGRHDPTDLGSIATPEDLAYVIYTSGSSGAPKGVMLDHRGRVNNFADFNRRFSVESGDRLLALNSLSFDMTAYDVFGTLAAGATIVLPDAAAERDPGHWARLINEHSVTIWHSAPAMLQMLLSYVEGSEEMHPRSLRLCLLGGDWIPLDQPDRLRAVAPEARVISLGGATEASMDSTIYEIGEVDASWTSIPYGRPMANQLAYVLDEFRQPVPIGVPGELYLGGIGVGRGYWNREELSRERFLDNPFTERARDRIYRTGDLARHMADGNLELLGRLDNQVKIRGHRIELGEVESVLSRHPQVKDAVVTAPREGKAASKLVAYVMPVGAGDRAESEPTSDDLPEMQVAQWKSVYDETYGQSGESDEPTFNIVGWNSSYTGLPLPAEQMKEWLDRTVERILARRPNRVVEIGCGSGLILFRVAPHCASYVGTDLSAVGLDYIAKHIQGEGLSGVSLIQSTAHDLEGIADRSCDMVVLNSVTQLFPSVEYLRDVLLRAVQFVDKGGSIFIGDVRSLPLFEAFHVGLQCFLASGDTTNQELRRQVDESMRLDEQLSISPDFFSALRRIQPRITNVLAQPKRGGFDNELNRYRYDVLLELDGQADVSPSGALLDWQEDSLTERKLLALIRDEGPDRLTVARIPNSRLSNNIRQLEWLFDSEDTRDVSAVRSASADQPSGFGVDPDRLWKLTEGLPYDVFVGWSESGGIGCVDAVFSRRGGSSPPAQSPSLPARQKPGLPWAQYGNQVLQRKLEQTLPSELRSWVRDRLPGYMRPDTYVVLQRFPLSPNGKVDRRRLPEPGHSRGELETPYRQPCDAIETVLVMIWEDVLQLDGIGADDEFADLGGNSLLATQIHARVRELIPVELPLSRFFGAATVGAQARALSDAGADTGVNVADAAEFVVSVSRLSDDQLEAELERSAGDEEGFGTS